MVWAEYFRQKRGGLQKEVKQATSDYKTVGMEKGR